ncbi:MAG: class I SAM-dependent RNA methyltransferase [Pyrinomonadaceae bacterium]|nr:class I SAM-dependent RNA methyltransferase [Pyrinomonadaceae bacterium]
MSKKYNIGDTLEVVIEKIVPNGLGLSFVEDLTVFVPLSARGDRLSVEIRQLKGKTAFAKIVGILDPSESRIEPKCEYFGTCGGCNFQQMNYQAQLEAKVGIIRDSLSRIGKIEFDRDIPIVSSPEQLGYRLRAQWHADTVEKKIGYFKRQSHEIVVTETCPILDPTLEKTLNELQQNLEWETFLAKEINIEAAAGENEEISAFSAELIEPTREISIKAGGERYFFNARSFFQGNKYLVEELLTAATENAKGETALDLYSGVGLFTVALSKSFEKVISVEASSDSVGFAKKNAAHAKRDNIEFHKSRIKHFLNKDPASLSDIDFILLDPPRSGVKRQTLERIAEIGARSICYVSCNPSTLARDLGVLLQKKYEIKHINALDLFPQTHHVESVVRLERI